jgi:uncharacterized protein YidB (DUF937 family)
MSLLDGLIGGAMAAVVNNLIQEHGGVSGIVSEFKEKGLGDTVKSWVSTGANDPVTADAIHQTFGSEKMTSLAARFGMTPDELAEKLSQVLPGAVDKLTPNGQVPS